MKHLFKRLQWVDWEITLLKIWGVLLALVGIAYIVLLILCFCGVLPMNEDSNSTTQLNLVTTICNSLRIVTL